MTDEFAGPVEGDDEDVARWRPLLAQTQLESTPLRLAFNADLHGWRPDAFHERVDGLGAALVVAQTGGTRPTVLTAARLAPHPAATLLTLQRAARLWGATMHAGG